MVDLDRIKKKRVFVLVGAVMLLVTTVSFSNFVTTNRFKEDWYPSIPFQEGTSYATWSFFSIIRMKITIFEESSVRLMRRLTR